MAPTECTRPQLVSAGRDGTVRWWWLDVEPLRAAVEAVDIGELNEAERERVSHLLGRGASDSPRRTCPQETAETLRQFGPDPV